MKHAQDSAGLVPVLGVFAAECFEVARERGVNATALLSELGLPGDTLELATQFIDLGRLQLLMRQLWQHHPDHALGFVAGLRIPPTAFGSVGAAFMSAANLREGLELIRRYWGLVGRGVVFDHQVAGDRYVMTFRAERPVEPFLARWMVEAGVAASWRALQAALPSACGQVRVHLRCPSRPAHSSPDAPGLTVVHGSPLDQIVLDAGLLEQPFALHSRSGLMAAKRQCDAHLSLRGQNEPLSSRVRTLLGTRGAGFPSLVQAADLLSVSPRTLRRRLAAERACYSELLKEARMLEAVRLLRDPSLSIADIAQRLGYRDDSNFGRAFRRWARHSPTTARRTLSDSQDIASWHSWDAMT
jgi:AraC-like DNA-binding protein